MQISYEDVKEFHAFLLLRKTKLAKMLIHSRKEIKGLKAEVERMNNEKDSLLTIIEDKSPYSAQKYWEGLLGTLGKGRDDLQQKVARTALFNQEKG